VKIDEIWQTSKTWLDVMSIDLEGKISDLSSRRARIMRWYKLSPYQFDRCAAELESLLEETGELVSFIKECLDQRDADMRKITKGLIRDLKELKMLKQEMHDYQKSQPPK
jgi:hypothetical protein